MMAVLHPVSVTVRCFSYEMNQRCFITAQLASSPLVSMTSPPWQKQSTAKHKVKTPSLKQ